MAARPFLETVAKFGRRKSARIQDGERQKQERFALLYLSSKHFGV